MHETDVATPASSPAAAVPVPTVAVPTVAVPVVLNPAARLLWRDHHAVQLELGARAVVVEGAAPEALHALASSVPVPGGPSGSRVGAARRVPAAGAHALLGDRATADLVRGGFVWPRRARECDPDPRLHPPVPRLACDLAALAARHGDGSSARLWNRRSRTVAVHGSGRVAAHLAALLAAAGVGHVHLTAADDVRLHQAMPGGLTPADEGRRFLAAATAAVHRAAPDADAACPPMDQHPDLAVLAFDEPVDSERRDALHARAIAHLTVRLAADHGVVGPLVIPGRTSCLRCADLHRRDRDPAWPALAVQLTVPRRHGPASDVGLATVIAGVAGLQVLCFLDGDRSAAVDGTLEMHLPDWRLRRRSWPVHPDCDCQPDLAVDHHRSTAPHPVSQALGTMAQ